MSSSKVIATVHCGGVTALYVGGRFLLSRFESVSGARPILEALGYVVTRFKDVPYPVPDEYDRDPVTKAWVPPPRLSTLSAQHEAYHRRRLVEEEARLTTELESVRNEIASSPTVVEPRGTVES